MQKNSTLLKRIASESFLLNNKQVEYDLQPEKETLRRIMRFAAAYKSEKVTEDRFSDIYLN